MAHNSASCETRLAAVPVLQRGMAYLLVLFAIAAMGILAAAAGVVWQTEMQREREEEWLFVGEQYANAIAGYYAMQTTAGIHELPQRLEDLLQDKRFPYVVRHLRRLYPDPITGQQEWGLVKEGDRISGVVSQADGEVRRAANLPEGVSIVAADQPPVADELERQVRYRDVIFVRRPASTPLAEQSVAQ